MQSAKFHIYKRRLKHVWLAASTDPDVESVWFDSRNGRVLSYSKYDIEHIELATNRPYFTYIGEADSIEEFPVVIALHQ